MNWTDLFIIPTDISKPGGAWANQVVQSMNQGVQNLISPENIASGSISYPSSARGLNRGNVAAVDYLNADIAKHYKMGKASAYQEALANTAYQRSIADMKAAGLNPAVIFGAGRGQPASSSVYASSGSRGRSGRYGGRSSEDEKTFSGPLYSALSALGGLIGIGITKRPDGYWIGSQTMQGAMGLIDSILRK